MTSTEASTTASTAGTASSSSAPDTLSASLLLALPALPPTPSSASASSSACASVAFHLNQHAAPVFFPTALNVAPLLEPTLSAAPHLLPYTSQQSTVYFPTASPPPNAAPLDGGGCDWRTAPSGLYYPNHHAAAMQRQGLRVSWDTRSFDYSNTSVDSSALGMPRSSATALAATSGSLPSLPYSGYPAFEHHPGSRQLSGGGGGGGRQMSAGRRRWDSGSRWRSNAHSTPRQNTQQFYPQQHPQRQHHQQQPQEPRHIPLAAAADAANNSNIPFKEDRVTAQHDPATASPALSGVERLFDPQSVKAQYRGLQRPGAIDTAIDDRRDRKVTWRTQSSCSFLPHNQPLTFPFLLCINLIVRGNDSCTAWPCSLCPLRVCCRSS